MHRDIRNIYRVLVKEGWTIEQIDASDIFFLLELYFSEEEQTPQETVQFADQVPWL